MSPNSLHVVDASAPQEEESQKATKGARPTKPLPTDRITFDRQLSLLRTYASVHQQSGKPVTNAQVAAIVSMEASTVALANAFFTDVHLLQRMPDGGFVPSPEVMEFLHARAWNAETAGYKLAPIISEAWFAKAILSRLALDPIEEEKAIQVLGEEAVATPKHRVNLRTLISYMEVAGLAQRDGTMIRAGRNSMSVTASATAAPTADAQPLAEIPNGAKPSVATAFLAPAEGLVQFNVSVKVDMAEFRGWPADRIAAFFSGIAQVLAAKADVEKGASRE